MEAPFLDSIEPEAVSELRARGTVRQFGKGAALFHAGTPSDRVVVVLGGLVKLIRTTEDGKEVMLGLRGPGDLLGEQSALDGGMRSASALALEPVEALAVSTPDFLAIVTRAPEAALYLMRTLSERLRDADGKRVEFAAADSLGRVAARLVELAERFGSQTSEGLVVDVNITQEELAGWAGSSREAASRALQSLRSLGLVDTARRVITVKDLEGLRRHAA